MGRFRRQEDLLSKEREELGLDRLYETQRQTAPRTDRTPLAGRRASSRRPLIENPWFVLPPAGAILYAWNGNHDLILGLAILYGAIVVAADRLIRGRNPA